MKKYMDLFVCATLSGLVSFVTVSLVVRDINSKIKDAERMCISLDRSCWNHFKERGEDLARQRSDDQQYLLSELESIKSNVQFIEEAMNEARGSND